MYGIPALIRASARFCGVAPDGLLATATGHVLASLVCAVTALVCSATCFDIFHSLFALGPVLTPPIQASPDVYGALTTLHSIWSGTR